ncbi:hypothetical protein MWU61_00025 [Loktanella sp. F6476L]|uniref:hypothetical protein n=1 Tax=Loktanella sp. F6476L TaxID=2926405 RepID=UPI001FF628BE|nr:hypothetical protein [Loktanella sp. F6476L]MCK0118904.1 hypothetical protein [Loktanella sp. F6476L]
MYVRLANILSGLITVSGGYALAQDVDIDACFANKDAACLETFFADIVTNNSPEKSRAMYLLGVLQEQAAEYATAQETYMMSVGFGGGDEPNDALKALFASQPEVFDDPADCFQIESEQCFQQIIENDAGESGLNAKFLLGSLLLDSKDEAARGIALLEEAANGGHRTAPCVLQEAFGSDGQQVAGNYDKFVTFGRQCGLDDPLPQLDDSHYSEYEGKKDNKAYAINERGVSSYSSGIATPEIAARLALEYCNSSPHRRSDSAVCQVVNINEVWVDSPETSEIPDFSGGIDGLISLSAKESYSNQYVQEDDPKVFVQSRSGSWQWQSAGSSGRTIEDLTERALERCNSGWQKRLGYPCEVINVNGEWID